MPRSSRTRRSAGGTPLPHADINASGAALLRSSTRRIFAWMIALGLGVIDIFCIYELVNHGKAWVLILIVPLTVLAAWAWLTAGACVIADPGADALLVKNAASTKQVLWSTISGFTIVQRNRPFATIQFLVLERTNSPEVRLTGFGSYQYNGAPDPTSSRLTSLQDAQRELTERLGRHRTVLAEQPAAPQPPAPDPPAAQPAPEAQQAPAPTPPSGPSQASTTSTTLPGSSTSSTTGG